MLENREADKRAAGDEAFAKYSAAEAATKALKKRLQGLAGLFPSTMKDNGSVRATIQRSDGDLQALTAVNEAFLVTVEPEFRKSPEAQRLAERVFCMPELLEHILDFLPVEELVYTFRVNKRFHNAITGSTKLQRRLALEPDPDAHLYVPTGTGRSNNAQIVHVLCHADSARSQREPLADNELPISVGGLHRKPPPKLRSMMITQPPLKSLKVWTACCLPMGYPHTPPVMTLTSERGIKVDEVWEIARD